MPRCSDLRAACSRTVLRYLSVALRTIHGSRLLLFAWLLDTGCFECSCVEEAQGASEFFCSVFSGGAYHIVRQSVTSFDWDTGSFLFPFRSFFLLFHSGERPFPVWKALNEANTFPHHVSHIHDSSPTAFDLGSFVPNEGICVICLIKAANHCRHSPVCGRV